MLYERGQCFDRPRSRESSWHPCWWFKCRVAVYYESIKRELKRRLIYEYRCDERLKTKTEESTRLSDTGLVPVVELEHLKTKTRLIDKKFASVRGECEI